MLGHIGLNVADLPAAEAYYAQLMPLLGYEKFFANETECAFLPAAGKRGTYLFIYEAQEPGGYSRHRPGLQHLAFIVPSRSAVRDVHARVTALGDHVLHTPRVFPQYPPPYFATFWIDPFGFMLEAVCHHDRE